MSSNRVSIIIPTRNRSVLLSQALRSACRQDWDNLELIVVDEASTDNTLNLLERHFPQVKVVRHDRAKGPGAARNSGVAASSGEYILFLDDDDLLRPDHVRALHAAASTLPSSSVVSGRWRRFQCTGTEVMFGPVMCCPEDRADDETLVEFLEPLGEGSIWTSSVLWSRAVFERVNWDESLFTSGDVDFFGRVVLSGYRILGRPVGMAYYRTHSGERVAGTISELSLLSATQYHLKWNELLKAHSRRDTFRRAMQNAFMSQMISWPRYPGAEKWLPILEDAYRSWDGRAYYLPVPPRNRLKRLAANLALKVGGPSAVVKLLALNPEGRQRPKTAHPGPLHRADLDDAQAVLSFL